LAGHLLGLLATPVQMGPLCSRMVEEPRNRFGISVSFYRAGWLRQRFLALLFLWAWVVTPLFVETPGARIAKTGGNANLQAD
jgi:hypothetical protein